MAADPDVSTEAPAEYDGFSDYYFVSRRIATAIDEAIEAFALIDSLVAENAGMDPRQAAEARAKILAAAMRLRPELEAEQDNNEIYADVLDDWADTESGDGWIKQLRETSLYDGLPPWMHEFVASIRSAGWHLGYLKAGRYEREPETPEGKAKSMFEEL